MQDNHDELDKILDEAIEAYADAEPLAGIDERILERIRFSARPRSNARAWRNAFLYGLAALLVAGSFAILLRRNTPEPSPIVSKTNAPDVRIRAGNLKAAPQILALPPRHPARHMLSRSIATGPKQNLFPAPSPLTREERLLQSLARTNPAQTADAPESVQQAIRPIEILPISISPLVSDVDGQ